MRDLAQTALWVLLTVAGLWVLWELRIAVVLLLLALAVSRALHPLFQTFRRRGISHRLSVVLAYASVLLILMLTATSLGPRLVNDSQLLVDDSIGMLRRLSSELQEAEDGTGDSRLLAILVPNLSEAGEGLSQKLMPRLAIMAIGATSGILSFIGYLGLVLVISIYWSLDQGQLQRWLFGLLWPEWRSRSRRIWDRVWSVVGESVRSELLISFTIFLSLTGLYSVSGVPYPTALALWAGIARMVPWLGVALAFLPLLALVGIELGGELLIILFGVMLYYVVERVWQRAVLDYEPPSRLLTGVLILALGKMAGLIGVVLAPPVAAAGHELLRGLDEPASPQPDGEGSADDFGTLKRRLTRITEQIHRLPEPDARQRWSDLAGKVTNLYRKAEGLERAERG